MKVKLKLYEHKPEETVIESFEAQSFDDFVIVKVDGSKMDQALVQSTLQALGEVLEGLEGDKRYLILDANADVTLYGVKEVPDNRSIVENAITTHDIADNAITVDDLKGSDDDD